MHGSRHILLTAFPLAASTIVLGCVSAPSQMGAARPKALAQCVASAQPEPPTSVVPVRVRSNEDVVLSVSRDVPGGLTSFEAEATGPAVLQMVDPMYADTVRAALIAASGADASPGGSAFVARVRGAEVRRVAFSRANLDDWRAYVGRVLWNDAKRNGVSISTIGTNARDVRIDVTVVSEADRAWVERRLAREPIPCGLIQIALGGPGDDGIVRKAIRVRLPRD